MRDEAPVYYNEEDDFYALTRHADVAAALKDFDTYLVGLRFRPVAWCGPASSPQKSIIFMDPPDHRHMRSLLNKVFTPRAIQSQRETVVTNDRQVPRQGRSRPVRRGPGLLRPVSGRGDHPMVGVPEEYRQQVRHWIDTSLHREPGQIDGPRRTTGQPRYRHVLLQPRPGTAREPAGRHDQPADRRRDPRRRRRAAPARRHRDRRLRHPARRRGRGDGDQADGQRGGGFARYPEQWQKLLDDRSKIPAAVEELLRYEAVRCSTTSATASRTWSCPAAQFRRTSRCSSWGPPPTAIRARSTTPTRSTSTATARRRRTSASATAFTAASARRWPAWRARSRWISLLDFMPRYEVDWDGLQRVQMQNVAGCQHVPVQGIAMSKIEVDFELVREQRRVHGHHPGGVRPRRPGLPARPAGRGDPGERGPDQEAVRQCPRQAISIREE